MHFEMFGASVLVGLMSGRLAGIAMKGGGYGLLWDVIFGLSGSFMGSWIFQTLGAPEAGGGSVACSLDARMSDGGDVTADDCRSRPCCSRPKSSSGASSATWRRGSRAT